MNAETQEIHNKTAEQRSEPEGGWQALLAPIERFGETTDCVHDLKEILLDYSGPIGSA